MASGANPAPFAVTGDTAGSMGGAIRMWQSGLSFTAGLLLSMCSLVAAADTVNQQRRQPLALSVAEFASMVADDSVTNTSVTPTPTAVSDPEQGVQTAQHPPLEHVDVAAPQTAERRTLSFSLVDFVEKEGTGAEVPRVSLVGLMSQVNDPETTEPVVATPPPAEQLPVHTEWAWTDSPSPNDLSVPVPVPVPEAEIEHLVLTPDLPSSVSTQQKSPSYQPIELTVSDSTSNTLQMFEAVHSALNEHPAIVESLSRLDEQQEQVSVARAGYLPQLRAGINTGYRHTTGRSEEALSVSASQMLYDFGKVSSAVDAATRGVDREEASVLLAAEDLIRDTSKAFIEARRYEVLLELATEQIDAITELEALATKRSAMGAATTSDQMQAQSRREAAQATQLQIQAQRDQWHRALENLIGSRERLVLDEIYPAPLEGLCSRLPENFESSPRVIIAEAERAEAEAAIRQARAEQRPTLSLSADFEHYLNRDTEGLQRLDDQELVVSLNLSSNLFQGGALRARSRAADHALYSATAARDRALLELSRLYRETRDRSRSLASSLTLQDGRHDSIVKTQELYRHQYLSLGTRTLLDILNTEQEIFQTQVDKQNTLFDLRSLQIDCLYSVGGLRETFRAGDALNHRVLLRRAEGRS